MTNEKTQLDKLLDYAESAMADGYPYEVIDGDLALTVKALRAFKASQNEPDGYSVGLHENPPDRSAEVFASISRELPTLYDEPTKPEYDDTGDLCVVKGCTGLACKGSFVCWDHRVKPENRGGSQL